MYEPPLPCCLEIAMLFRGGTSGITTPTFKTGWVNVRSYVISHANAFVRVEFSPPPPAADGVPGPVDRSAAYTVLQKTALLLV
jgi:hypothetical protein